MDTLIKRGFVGTDTQRDPNDYSIVVGTKQLKKALNRGTVLRAMLARDADPAITAPLESLCKETDTDYIWVETMADLGNACGIEVGAACAAIATA